MYRDDISNFLIHWTSGDTYQEAFESLEAIIDAQKIVGTDRLVRGNYKCICFTETPTKHFNFSCKRYKPFGIGFKKDYLFSLGARPVIYETEQEFNILPEIFQWKHVRFELGTENPIDFTWEREWRLKTDELTISIDTVGIIVPDRQWEEELCQSFNNKEWERYRWESEGYGEGLAQLPQEFLFKIIRKNGD